MKVKEVKTFMNPENFAAANGFKNSRQGFYKGESSQMLYMDGFSNVDSKEQMDDSDVGTNPNKLHDEAKKSGWDKGFTKFLDVFNTAKENGAINWLKNKIGMGDTKDLNPNDVPKKEDTKFLGMPKEVAIVVGVILGITLIFGVYKIVKSKG